MCPRPRRMLFDSSDQHHLKTEHHERKTELKSSRPEPSQSGKPTKKPESEKLFRHHSHNLSTNSGETFSAKIPCQSHIVAYIISKKCGFNLKNTTGKRSNSRFQGTGTRDVCAIRTATAHKKRQLAIYSPPQSRQRVASLPTEGRT